MLGGVGTRFQSLAGEVRSCRNWDCTRSNALYQDCGSLEVLSGEYRWYAKTRTHSVPSDIVAPFNVGISYGGRGRGLWQQRAT